MTLPHTVGDSTQLENAVYKNYLAQNSETGSEETEVLVWPEAREMNLLVGEQVLVQNWDSTQKFYCKWQAPFKVKRHIGQVNYSIFMCTLRHRIFCTFTCSRNGTQEHHHNTTSCTSLMRMKMQESLTEKPNMRGQDRQKVVKWAVNRNERDSGEFPESSSKPTWKNHFLHHRTPNTVCVQIRQRSHWILLANCDEIMKN